jgi:hypothetical protein
MAWHRIGNSFYSDAERRAIGQDWFNLLVDVGLPALFTYYGVTWLATIVERQLYFFVIHTASAKLLYIVTGVTIFCITYTVRRFILGVGVLALGGLILWGVGSSFFTWLLH